MRSNFVSLVLCALLSASCHKDQPPKQPTPTNNQATNETPPKETSAIKKDTPATPVVDEDEYQLFMTTAESSAEAKKYEDAVARYKSAQQLKPTESSIYFALGEVYRKWGESTKDKAQKTERLKLAKSNYEAYLQVVSTGANADKAKKAIQDIDKVIPK